MVCESPSKYRNLEFIDLYDEWMDLPSLYIVIDLQQQTNRLSGKLYRTCGDKQRLDNIFVQDI